MTRAKPNINAYEVSPGALALAAAVQAYTHRERRFPPLSWVYAEAVRIHDFEKAGGQVLEIK